ncbi:FAD:protein FMN transferase [Bradyrhizobium liaoningense]|uniref:FAD:protein FMN transferase n=2 Tax=Bradyrhizobium TaxID=374 RepID=UPI001BABCE61|nr:FAD:protein FMN transferase [Bradyrhizobium liaoningense]MBR0985598.1 FAD:protein FMN transferase [Bradyrhizobium liaoningense]GMO96704.1 FAD:protein FMN transferase [Bradyrhizobium sp. TM239]
MLPDHPTRRRAITILASAAAVAIAGPARPARADFEWRGTAMGADARILFSDIEPGSARGIAALVEAEIDRLENALSLFQSGSELRRLNRDGALVEPGGDLRRAVALALEIADLTNGLFDPTVQALWEAHVDWFADKGRTGLPPEAVIAEARRAVDWRSVRIGPNSIHLGDNQRLTLNGLGQGYVTDRVAEMLAAKGFTNILVDLGEQRAAGPRRDGSPWLIARSGADPLRLANGALATSEGSGCVLGADGAAHHLFDPRSGRSAAHWRTITVHHRSAAVADALSTALSIASANEIQELLPRLSGTAIWATDLAGRRSYRSADPRDGIVG